MILLNNSQGSQETLEKHISDKAVLESCGNKHDDSATKTPPKTFSTSNIPESAAKPLTKKEPQKLRQKTRKRLATMQAKEAENIIKGDNNLNSSVEYLIDPVKNSLRRTTLMQIIITQTHWKPSRK